MSEQVVVKKVDRRRRTMRLLEERFERERISNDLRYGNLESFAQMQDERISKLEALNEMSLRRVEQLEVEAKAKDKIHPLKKMLGIKAK
jgi:hypothetical protein